MKQKWKEERSEEKRKVIKTGGGPPPPPMGTVSELVEAVAGHMATRIANTDDSDGASYLAPVDKDDYQPQSPTYERLQDTQTDRDSQVNERTATPPRSSTATLYTAMMPSSVLPGNESAEGDPVPPETESTPVVPRGRIALLQKTLGEEADARFALLREEHSLRLRLLQEDHNVMLKKRDNEHKIVQGCTCGYYPHRTMGFVLQLHVEAREVAFPDSKYPLDRVSG
ncbi:hypothetical protein HPB49_002311 [Dermacentor silvarum]|uniref:Uncharacterized protein n=1 Tax=Dermacentor silvarum TaxID=543639 RepID=A0ACB8DT83_DERSI|nr:hypothetical protein HPB49_002311 [Dermacentor silvarum]